MKTAADIWEQKRGTPNEITRLFIAMTRAAGLKVSAMIVTERDKRMLNANYLHWDQLTDEIAIVQLGGKDVYFDPGSDIAITASCTGSTRRCWESARRRAAHRRC